MSILIWFALVFLCFSKCTCNARSFGVVREETAAGVVQNTMGEKIEEPANSIKGAKEILDPTGKRVEGKGGNVSGAWVGEESVASVSWKVPPKKRDEEDPGFNLDYLPPKTHPPVHN